MSEKKEMRIPRLWVYICAFFAGLVVTACFGLGFGVEFAVSFLTESALYGILFITAYNVMDKVDRQPHRLTVKYWVLIALIVVTDFLFLFAAKAEDKNTCIVRLCIFAVGLIFTGFYSYCIYAPSQKELFVQMKDEAKAGIAEYLREHAGEPSEDVAGGLMELIFAPKKKAKEEPQGEEADE